MSTIPTATAIHAARAHYSTSSWLPHCWCPLHLHVCSISPALTMLRLRRTLPVITTQSFWIGNTSRLIFLRTLVSGSIPVSSSPKLLLSAVLLLAIASNALFSFIVCCFPSSLNPRDQKYEKSNKKQEQVRKDMTNKQCSMANSRVNSGAQRGVKSKAERGSHCGATNRAKNEKKSRAKKGATSERAEHRSEQAMEHSSSKLYCGSGKYSRDMSCCIACSACSFHRSVPSNLHMSYTCHPRFVDWWLFLLLETVILPLLEGLCSSNRPQIHVDLSSRFVEFLPESNRRPRDWQSCALTN